MPLIKNGGKNLVPTIEKTYKIFIYAAKTKEKENVFVTGFVAQCLRIADAEL